MSSISCGCFINGITPVLGDRDVSFVIQIEINYKPLLIQLLINFLHTRVLSINCDFAAFTFLSQGGSVFIVQMAWERFHRSSDFFSLSLTRPMFRQAETLSNY